MKFDRCLITGTDQGGTNLLTEFVKATELFDFTEQVEDRGFFFYTTRNASRLPGTGVILHLRMDYHRIGVARPKTGSRRQTIIFNIVEISPSQSSSGP